MGNVTQITTPCLRKVNHLMFVNKILANVDRFSKLYYQLIRRKILYVHTTKISISLAVCCYDTL